MMNIKDKFFPEHCEFCSFWRRMSAFIIDMLLLFIVGFILGLVFEKQLVVLGPWGRVLGFIISIFYFGIMDSSIAGGQTIGKKLMKIKVVNILGETVNVIRCFFRAGIILVPFFLYGIMLPPSAFSSSATLIITFMFLGMLVGLAYFYVFNTRTRQSFHDIASGTYVVRESLQGAVAKSGHDSRSVPVLHFSIYLLLLAMVLGVSLFADYASKKPFIDRNVSYQNVIKTNVNITDYTDVYYSTIMTGEGTGPESGNKAVYLECMVYIFDRSFAGEENAKKIADVIIDNYMGMPALNYIEVVFMYGYDIGIASGWDAEGYQFTMK
ncbi:MAG: RDD family protein [Candidatus Goldiibacteriota bacterium]